jgi:arylsulfatase A-like enzyme
MKIFFVVLFFVSCSSAELTQAQSQRNVLFVLLDDVGFDQIEQTDTPVLDLVAENGIAFTNAWSQPSCSPTRLSILTGKHPNQTGCGSPVAWGQVWEPSAVHMTIGDFVMPSARIGKWHLSNRVFCPGMDPITWGGFDYYSGNLHGSIAQFGSKSYYDWVKVISIPGMEPHPEAVTTYATVQTTDDAIDWIESQDESWFCMVSYNAAHHPWHNPPANLHGTELDGSITAQYRAAVQALDSELGRLIMEIPSRNIGSTTIIVMGDNGPPSSVTDPFVPVEFGKGSVYQGGVHVPLLIASVDLTQPGRIVSEPVMAVDIYDTVLSAMGIVGELGEGQSLMPFLRNPDHQGRGWSYAETFAPNGSGPYDKHEQAVMSVQGYKLIRRQGEADELYHVDFDPKEMNNLLLGELTEAEQTALDELESILIDVS